MKLFTTLSFMLLLFCNCERQHYGCICYHPYYTEDYGTHFTSQESRYKSECEKHEVEPNTNCELVINY